MSFRPNVQQTNSPTANGTTESKAITIAVAPGVGTPTYELIANEVHGLTPEFSGVYYLIIQNIDTRNVEVTFNDSVDGLIIYPSATFELAVTQGAQVYLKNDDTTNTKSVRIIAFS